MVHAHIPGGGVSSETWPSQLSTQYSLQSCRDTCMYPFSSKAIITDRQIPSVVSEPGLTQKQLVRTLWQGFSERPGWFTFTKTIIEGFDPSWVATCSHPQAAELNTNLSDWGGISFELLLSRVWVPEEWQTQRCNNCTSQICVHMNLHGGRMQWHVCAVYTCVC